MNIPHRDLTLHYPLRQEHEPHRFRFHHKPTGLDGIGEASTLEQAQVVARADLEKKLHGRIVDAEVGPTVERLFGHLRTTGRGKPWP